MPWLPVLHSREDTITYFTDHVLLHEEVLVAEANHLVVGFIALLCDHIDHLYIAPAYQHQGIGDKTSGYREGVVSSWFDTMDIPGERAGAPIL